MTSTKRSRGPGPPKVGLIVEGDTEHFALPLLHTKALVTGCPPLKSINLGGVGSDRAPVGIAKLVVGKVIQHQVSGCQRVIVCLDREQRKDCAGQFATSVAKELAAELSARRRATDGVHVVVADRTFEAWILADAKGLHGRIPRLKAPTSKSFEGQMGIDQKKGTVELSNLLGRPYRKTVDGPRLFAALDFSAARRFERGGTGSRSLDKLLRTLGL